MLTGAKRTGVIAAENAKPGTLDWIPRNVRFEPFSGRQDEPDPHGMVWLDSGRCRAIEGWCAQPSVKAGESLAIHVSTDPPGEYTIDIYRMGFYGGLGARHLTRIGPLRGTAQPDPQVVPGQLVECDWAVSHEIVIPADWVSGVYLVKLIREDNGGENYAPFILRDERQADLIVQACDFTWQAYNRWPDIRSLYSDGTLPLGAYSRDLAVSFDRPYLASDFPGAVPAVANFVGLEFPFHYWLESMGYDVTYCSNLDTHLGRALFERSAGFLSLGHDEYWTLPMYENLRAAVGAGLNIGFFTGNTCNCQIDLRPGSSGRPNRVFSRHDLFGPPGGEAPGYAQRPEEILSLGFPNRAPDEGLLIGARNQWPVVGCGDWVCSQPDHWVFAGTGMRKGDRIPNLVGHEWQGAPARIDGLEVVSTGPTFDRILGAGEYTATVYPGPHGNCVFNASSCWWGTALALPPGVQRPTYQGMPSALPDARAQRITANVLERLSSRAA